MPMKRGSDGRPVNVPTQSQKSGAEKPASPKPPRAPKLNLGDEPTGPAGGRADRPDSGKRSGLGLWPRDDAPTVPGGRRQVREGDEVPPRGTHERRGPGGSSLDDAPTAPAGKRAEPADDGMQPTVPRRRAGQAEPHEQGRPRKASDMEEPTVLVPGREPSRGADRPGTSGRLADLPTGWLVVVDGPGKGTALPLGFGHNTIGRGAGMRVRLNFGDGSISREHTAIRYSDKNNSFHIFPGNNNVYLAENEEVLVPTTLHPGCLIGLGETTLRFVPFCDDSFRWD